MEGGGEAEEIEDERKMRGRKEERWFNRTGGSNGLVKALAKRSVSMREGRRDVFKRVRRKE